MMRSVQMMMVSCHFEIWRYRRLNEKMIVACPVCGRQLLKSNSGTHAELSCPKCCSELNCSVNGATVSVEVVKKSQKQKRLA